MEKQQKIQLEKHSKNLSFKKKVRQNRRVGFERFNSSKGKGKESQRLSLKKRQDGKQKERETAMEKQIKGTDTKREKEKQT